MKSKIQHIHFVGIGGSGMSGIAEVLLQLGYSVSGSDLSEGEGVRRLREAGAAVNIGHAAANIRSADVVVVSSAVAQDNPEVVAAREKKIPVIPRAVMLAELMRFRQGIAVAGTHGKTTTTSLVAHVLTEAGMDPTAIIGGRLNSIGTNAKLGQGEYLVAEADESDASFLHLKAVMAVVTNIDRDHMDTYGHDFGRLLSAFADFIEQLPFYGLAVLCGDDANIRSLQRRLTRPVLTYGLSEDVDLRAVDMEARGGVMAFRAVARKDGSALDVLLNLAGEHNVKNALAAIAIARECGVEDAAIARALASFAGVGRRFQRAGELKLKDGAALVIDDYGHHPAEMAATIAAARGAYPGRRLLLVFQPHRYTRTRDLLEDFAQVIAQADAAVLTEVYAAGEPLIRGAEGRDLAAAVQGAGAPPPLFVPQLGGVADAVANAARHDDVVLVMGAGSIGQLAAQLVRRAGTGPANDARKAA
ncbi:MAG: UDP-N-acetylmuramate--L-alanine ligase [Betaproteobacteria bacterium]|nr:UDP-N-acetylmuramate--L-alanine ligase [Betaproteobacteria bacterium]